MSEVGKIPRKARQPASALGEECCGERVVCVCDTVAAGPMRAEGRCGEPRVRAVWSREVWRELLSWWWQVVSVVGSGVEGVRKGPAR